MSNLCRYNSPTNRGPSVALWGNMSKIVADAQMGKCGYVWDDFMGFPLNITNTTANIVGNWQVTTDANVVVHQKATCDLSVGELGVVHFDAMETDNDEAMIFLNSVAGGSFKFDSTYTASKILFECRVMKETVANTNTVAFFAGLAGYSLWAAGAALLTDGTGALISTADAVGFSNLHADGDGVDAVYQDNGQTLVTVLDSAGTMTAATWMKLGFLYDLTNASKAIRYFVDGVEVAATTAANVTSTALAAAGFPDDAVCNPGICLTLNGTTETDFYVDWIAAAQYVDPLD